MVMGTVLMNYMSFYVASLSRAGVPPAQVRGDARGGQTQEHEHRKVPRVLGHEAPDVSSRPSPVRIQANISSR